MTIKEQAALYIQNFHPALAGLTVSGGESNLHIFPPLAGYVEADVEWTLKFVERIRQIDRLRAQRPLIHNGRKMKR